MMEMYGLRMIVSDAVEKGTLHVMQQPPHRREFDSAEAYEAAYDKWWTMHHCWTVTNIGDSPDDA